MVMIGVLMEKICVVIDEGVKQLCWNLTLKELLLSVEL